MKPVSDKGRVLIHTIMIILIMPVLYSSANMESFDPKVSISELRTIFNDNEIQSNEFVENRGQWDPEILFVADTTYGRVGLCRDGIYHNIVRRKDIAERQRTYDYGLHSHDSFDFYKSSWIKITFEGSNVKAVLGYNESHTKNNYFLGNDPSKWCSGAKSFRSVIYGDIWDGIDLKYYFSNKSLKYDFLVSPGADPDQIRMKVAGSDRISISDDTLYISTSLGFDLIDGVLFTYYLDTHEMIRSRFKVNDDIISYDMDTYDNSRPIVIDPEYNVNGIRFSTFIGGSSDDRGLDAIIDDSGDILILGETSSADFPIPDGSLDQTIMGYYDILVLKIDRSGRGLIFRTFVGGSGREVARGIDINDLGEVYVGGNTQSEDFPTTDGAYCTEKHNTTGNYAADHEDIYIFKLNNDGSDLIYSTFFGGSLSDSLIGLEKMNDDVILFVGYTTSKDFPISDDAYQKNIIDIPSRHIDISITILDLDRSELIYSTYLGGSANDMPHDMKYDGVNCIFIVGETDSTDFNITEGSFQSSYRNYKEGFLLKFNLSMNDLDFSTYFGGWDYDYVSGLDIDSNGNIYACGTTHSIDLPVTHGAYQETRAGGSDGFLMGLDSTGSSLLFCTYLGGSNVERLGGISRSADGYLHVLGTTLSNDLYIPHGAIDKTYNGTFNGNDGFYVKFDHNCSQLLYSTYIGGWDKDEVRKIIFDDDANEVLITGWTSSLDFPVKKGSYDTTFNGGTDIFVIKFNQTLPPSQPLNLTAYSGDSFVQLRWDPPVDDGGSPVDHYRIIRGTRDNTYTDIVGESLSTRFNDTSVVNGVTYYYIVRAHNWIDYGPRSDQVSARPAARPSPPGNLSVDNYGNMFVDLSWSSPVDKGGIIITGYNLYRFDGNDTDPIKIESIPHSRYSDKTVMNGVHYSYRVTAVNEIGESEPSNRVNITPMTYPDAIRDLKAFSGPGYVLLNWSAPLYNGGGPIIDFTISRSDGDKTVDFVVSSDRTWYNDTEVKNGIRYWYHVVSRNMFGYSGGSNGVSGEPMSCPSPPRDLIAVTGSRSIKLSWSSPLGDGGFRVTGYNLYRNQGEGEWKLLSELKEDQAGFTDTNLINGNVYIYRVTAINKVGESDPSDELHAIPKGAPSMPGSFSLVCGDGFVYLEWREPVSDGGYQIDSYRILRGENEQSLWPLLSLSGETLSYNDTDVINGRIYYYSLVAINSFGDGPSTELVMARPGSLPSPPSGVSFIPGDGYVNIYWSGPVSEGGFPVTKVTIYRGTSGTAPEKIFGTDQIQGFYMDKGLINGKEYFYSLTCLNEMGESEHTEEYIIIPAGKPSAPLNLEARSITSSSLALFWSVPDSDGGSPLTGYRIYRYLVDGDVQFLGEVSEPAFHHSGLIGGETYVYLVTAVNPQGESEYSDPLIVPLPDESGSVSVYILLISFVLIILMIAVFLFFMVLRKKKEEPQEEIEKTEEEKAEPETSHEGSIPP